MLSRLKDLAHRIATDPARAGQAVLACILTVGVVALTLDIAPRILPRQLKSDVLDPLDPSYWDELTEYQETSRELDEAEPLKENCASARSGKSYDTLLTRFEDSFAGVLPGGGNLLNEHASTVSKRRERLIFEVMKNYAKTKFCIQAGESDESVNEFKSVYQTEYSSLLGKLDLFLQVRLYEKDSTHYPLGKDNPVPRGMPIVEYELVKKDLQTTQVYVADIIDRAIESAIALDGWTEQRIGNLTARTTNKLSLGNNELTHVANKIRNENITANSYNSRLLQEINKNLANTQPWPVGLGGAGVNDYRKYGTEYQGSTHSSQVYVPGSADIDNKKAGIAGNVTFGLLNLVDPATRSGFLQNRFARALAMYVGATANVDPFAPGGQIKSGPVLSENTIAHGLCQSIDSGKDCYSKDKPGGTSQAVRNSVSIESETSPARAAGMLPSQATTVSPPAPAGPTGINSGLTNYYPYPITGGAILSVDIVQREQRQLNPVRVEHVDYNDNSR